MQYSPKINITNEMIGSEILITVEVDGEIKEVKTSFSAQKETIARLSAGLVNQMITKNLLNNNYA